MLEIETPVASKETLAGRAQNQFNRQRQQLWGRSDRLFAWLMGLEWLAAILAALWLSPTSWIGQTSQVHVHVWAAFLLGGAIVSLPISLTFPQPGFWLTRHAI